MIFDGISRTPARLAAQFRAAGATVQRTMGTTRSNLFIRVVSTALGLPFLFVMIFANIYPPYPALLYVIAAVGHAWICAGEFYGGAKRRGLRPAVIIGFAAVALLQIAAYPPVQQPLSTFVPIVLTILVMAAFVREVVFPDSAPLANVGVTALGVLYTGWFFQFLVLLRTVPGTISVAPFGSGERGAWIVFYVFVVTWSMDTTAYFIGRKFGKHKLLPRLSPKKTVEGSLGGLVGSTLFSLGIGAWIGLPWYHCLILGPLFGIIGQTGDLWASAMKRESGLKDFGTVLPGHGGLLDRFDSLLFTAPFAWYYLTAFVLGR